MTLKNGQRHYISCEKLFTDPNPKSRHHKSAALHARATTGIARHHRASIEQQSVAPAAAHVQYLNKRMLLISMSQYPMDAEYVIFKRPQNTVPFSETYTHHFRGSSSLGIQSQKPGNEVDRFRGHERVSSHLSRRLRLP